MMNGKEINFRVGTTRSGKMIHCASDLPEIAKIAEYFKNEGFSDDDLLDAFALFEYLTLRAMRRGEFETKFKDHSVEILLLISDADLADAKVRANVYSAFQLRDLGKSRAAAEFKDL